MTPVTANVAPSATTDTEIYTVGADTVAKIEKVWVVERAGGTPTFRLALVPDGQTLNNKHYIVYDDGLAANETLEFGPFYLNAGDSLRAYASDANTTFIANGYENDAS